MSTLARWVKSWRAELRSAVIAGTLVKYGIMFMFGVMTALIFTLFAVHDVVTTERALGECDVGCCARGYELSTVYDNVHCQCWKIGHPDEPILIDPHDPVSTGCYAPSNRGR